MTLPAFRNEIGGQNAYGLNLPTAFGTEIGGQNAVSSTSPIRPLSPEQRIWEGYGFSHIDDRSRTSALAAEVRLTTFPPFRGSFPTTKSPACASLQMKTVVPQVQPQSPK